MWIIQEPKKIALWNKRHFEEKNGVCSMFKILSTYSCWKNIYKMQHLKGSGTPFLYIGRTVLKDLHDWDWSLCSYPSVQENDDKLKTVTFRGSVWQVSVTVCLENKECCTELSHFWQVGSCSVCQEFASILLQPKVQYCVHNSLQFLLILSRMNPIQSFQFFKSNKYLTIWKCVCIFDVTHPRCVYSIWIVQCIMSSEHNCIKMCYMEYYTINYMFRPLYIGRSQVLTCICLSRRLFRVTLKISRAEYNIDVTPGTLTATDTCIGYHVTRSEASRKVILHTRYVSTCVGTGGGRGRGTNIKKANRCGACYSIMLDAHRVTSMADTDIF
jgi:hypothetical protein